MDESGDIEITDFDDVSVISFCSASINGGCGVEKISSRVREFIAESRPKKLVVDFSGVKFFSSQMLGLLVDVWRRLKEDGGVVRISGINPQLNRVFKITNLDRIFQFHPDKETAVRAFADNGS